MPSSDICMSTRLGLHRFSPSVQRYVMLKTSKFLVLGVDLLSTPSTDHSPSGRDKVTRELDRGDSAGSRVAPML